MQRRTFIQSALLVGGVAVLPSCRGGGARTQVLRALVEQVVVPNTAALARDSRALENEIVRFASEPTVTALRAVRARWQRALLNWKRADVFRSGPIMDSNSLLRAMFWPVRSGAIEALVQGSQALEDSSIEAIGVDRRGLFALEYLLFFQSSEEQCVAQFAVPTGERRARLARSLAGNVAFHADAVARALGDGKKYAAKFADGEQDSLNHLVAQLIFAVENVSANRLGRISTLAKSGRLAASEIEGSASGMSQQIALAYLRATEQLYLGVDHGIAQLVKASSAAVDERIRSDFARAISLVSNLGQPLEAVASTDIAALDLAAAAVKALERALKTELTSVLGVTLTFSSLDGD